MHIRLELPFEAYLAATAETEAELLATPSPVMAAIKGQYDFFRGDLWTTTQQPSMSPEQGFLSVQAFMLWLAAVRVALSGHASATLPLFRTALEAACYAFLMKDDENLIEIWSNRHATPEAERACRRAFGQAVDTAAKHITLAGDSHLGSIIREAYQTAIDYGAHPNVTGVFRHLRVKGDEDEHVRVDIIGLYGANHFETKRMLVACLDYGLTIACVLAHGLHRQEEHLTERLDALNTAKEYAVASL